MNVTRLATAASAELQEAQPLNTGLLIAEVHARRPLWDKRHELHNQRELIEALWNEVAVVTGASVPRIRSKWKNLKDSFRREAKRAFTELNYRPRWRLYQSLMFLYDQQMEFDVKEEDRNSLHSTYLEPDQTQCEYDPLNNENEPRNNPAPRPEYYGPEGYFYPGRGDLHVEDADMCFFRSLLPHMKELTPQKRMHLRIKIHEMVYKEVYSDKNETARAENQKNTK